MGSKRGGGAVAVPITKPNGSGHTTESVWRAQERKRSNKCLAAGIPFVPGKRPKHMIMRRKGSGPKVATNTLY